MSKDNRPIQEINSVPPFFNNNRDENFLIEVPGIVIPEADLIFYGLLNSEIGENFPLVRDATVIEPSSIYYELAFFNRYDILKTLKGLPNECVFDPKYDSNLDTMYKIAVENYSFTPWNETMMFHSIMEAAMFDFVKSVTFLFDRTIRNLDMAFLMTKIPPSITRKVNIVSGSLLETIEENGKKDKDSFRYTTVINNSLDDIETLLSNRDKYNIDDTLFLLRSHSGNMCSYEEQVPDTGLIRYKISERGNERIYKLIEDKNGIPITKNRFYRFRPGLYKDMVPQDINSNNKGE